MMKALRILFALGAACLAPTAGAHMMEAGHGSVRLVGESAYLVLAVPVAAFTGADDNRDGLLDRDEVNKHRTALSAQVSALLALDHSGDGGAVVFEDLVLSHAGEEGARGEAQLVVLRRYVWPQAVRSLRVKVGPGLLAAPGTAGGQLKMRVIEGEHTEVAVFKGLMLQHTFLRRARTP